MRNILDLHPKLQSIIKDFKKMCNAEGLKVGIGECLRTKEEQDALYALGRTQQGSIVTNAKGSTFSSMHQWGVAFDFYRNDGKGTFVNNDAFFEKVAVIGKKLGLLWGGDFRSIQDKPHLQLPEWGTTPSKLKKQFSNPENFFKTWEVDTMTTAEKKEFDTLINDVNKLKANLETIYRYTQDIPEWARPTIQKLLDKGYLAGNAQDDLNLPESLIRVLVINDRAGLYD